MKWLIVFFCLPLSASEIWLKVGESKILPASPTATVRVGSRGIVRAIDTPSGLRIIGMKPGTTALAVDGKNFMLRVSYSSQKEFLTELRESTGTMLGLKLYSDEKEIRVGGTLLKFSDWQEIAEIASRHQGEYVFAAHALPDVAAEALEHFKKLAQEKAIPVTRFSADPQFTAHVPKSLKNSKGVIEQSFSSFGIRVDVSDSVLAVEPLVRTRVVLAEVSKNFASDFGIGWPSEYSAQVLPVAVANESLLASLRALEAKGQAQVLASPVLVCRSGSEAKFHAGGEFPIRMIGRNSRDVMWKQHGVILNVKPKADYNGSISLEIETEISLLDMAGAIDGVPALKTNSVRSHFDLSSRRTVALSGLLRQELGETRQGLPYLSRVPVLGRLFSSKQYLNNQTELVVFVTPEIYSPQSNEPVAMPEGWVSHEF